ncbi:MAG: bifunctional phosphopantothenoylcysteine decarboxylase/phosphopantothenate--cysteine ligase CoaBC [Deltaproteobacteria bacterium]|nr:bifunctional phosphopantothenoylcysteine decarboxylase/phosphopantothenate--cysteine ligase CoaBC [Deltaproteobacteria bacterium]
MSTTLSGKNIVLCVSGGIAAYKAVEIVRLLQKAGAVAHVAMTQNAARFVGPITFEAISGHPVFMDMFAPAGDPMRHISWAQEADAVVVVPATANIIAKLANGIADDAVTTLVLAVTSPKLICPAMNVHMYENRAVQRNIDTLEQDGFLIVEPGVGDLACGDVGPGRLAEPPGIVENILRALLVNDYNGKRVLVTAGPTREVIDPVRFISNPSSGKMGYAVARAAAGRGAEVTLVSGPVSLADPLGIETVRVSTAAQMADEVLRRAVDADVIVKVAAVADFRPSCPAAQKIKKNTASTDLKLERTVDILAELGRLKKPGQVLVGFAAETEELEKNAVKKLEAKNLDLIAANLINEPGSGFGVETNRIRFFYPDGRDEALPEMEKDEAAHVLLDRIVEVMKNA